MSQRLQIPFVLFVLALLLGPALAQDSITLSQARLGNVFLSTETVQIPVQTTGTSVNWTVKDFFGVEVAGGTTPVPVSGSAVIEPALGRLGYFELHLAAFRNSVQVAVADTTFAVVVPSNVSAMHDSPFGVDTHFAHGWTNDIMQILARGGMSQFRDEQYWQNVEPVLTTPPTYTFAPYQSYMAAAASLGLNPLMELDFANSNYDGGFTPYTAEGRTGYSNYAKALLAQYGSQIKTVEVWNEINGSFWTGPDPNADRAKQYRAMLINTYNAIKAVRPDVRVLGGACVPVPLPWFQRVFEIDPQDQLGAQDYLDVIAIHPYRSIPEGVEQDIAALQQLSASFNHGQGPKPIWATECGAPDTVNRGRQDMARYLVRLMTLMRTAGVERMYWYSAFDYDGYETGLVRSPIDALGPYAPSAAFPAYANLIQQLYHATYVARENTDARTRMYHFTRSGSDVRVVWSTAGTAQLVLTTSSPLTRIDIMGSSTVLQPVNGTIAITADTTPFYLIGPISAVREFGRDAIVADTVRDFSNVQGTTNGTWSYLNGYVIDNAYNPNDAITMGPMAFAATQYGFEYNSFYSFAKIDANGGHPSGRFGYEVVYPVWTIRRWLSNVTATARFSGTIVRAAPYGDGTGVRIYVDGSLVYSTLIGGAGAGQTIGFNFVAPLQVGSKVDFAFTPGPGTNVDFDYTDFRAEISIPRSAPTTFSEWQEQNFTAAEFVNPSVSALDATPAGDGVQNVLKYSVNRAARSPAFASLPGFSVTTIGNDKYLTMSYRKATAATDLAFTTEFNSGAIAPGDWVPGGIQVGSPVLNPDGTQTITVRDQVPINSAGGKRFMRLKVTR